MNDLKAHCLLPLQNALGEGPLYDNREKQLYWVDILKHKIHCYHEKTKELQTFDAPPYPSALLQCSCGKKDAFILCAQQGLFLWSDNKFTLILEVETELPNNRLNDAAVDPHGNLWFGSMDIDVREKTGRFYCLTAEGNFWALDGRYDVTNGPCFNGDGSLIYLNDSENGQVLRGTLNKEGSVTDISTWITFTSEEGHPDGPITDSDDHLWIAHWGGGCISRYTPSGTLDMRIPVPAPQLTKCAFGGEDLSTMYITSARNGLSEETLQNFPDAGGLFICKPHEISGRPAPVYRIPEKLIPS